jgi:hypothetical protein
MPLSFSSSSINSFDLREEQLLQIEVKQKNKYRKQEE